jgi:hypothetical protein
MSKNENLIEAINGLLDTDYSHMASEKNNIISYVKNNKVMLDEKMNGTGLPSPLYIAKKILTTFPNVALGGRRRSSKSSKKQSARRRRSSKARKSRKSRATRRK